MMRIFIGIVLLNCVVSFRLKTIMKLKQRKRFLKGGEFHCAQVERIGFESITDSSAVREFGLPASRPPPPRNTYLFALLKGRIHWFISPQRSLIQQGGTALLLPAMPFPTPLRRKQPPGLIFWICLECKRRETGESFSCLLDRLPRNSGNVTPLSNDAKQIVNRLIRLIDVFPDKDRIFAELRLRILTLDLLAETVRMQRSPNHSTEDEIVEAGIKYMEEHYSEKLTLADLEKHLGYSVPWILRHFRNYAGMPPHHYLERYRVERAEGLLTTGRMTITDVALECGFNSSQHFSRSFKKITGLTPTQVRKNAGADAQQL